MRLIDADALLQAIEDNSPMNWTDSESEIQADIDYKCFADMVKNQPTAYDVDAVVEQLETHLTGWMPIQPIDRASEIIRKAGGNNDIG